MKTRTLLFHVFSWLLVVSMLAACAPKATQAPAASGGGETGAMADLVAAAKKEGTLTTIALPHDWCNYGGTIEAFKAKYGIKVNELAPDGTSADELEAVKANKGSSGPQ